MENSVQVQASSINGQGLFALRVFVPGEVVLRWDLSTRLTNEEVQNLRTEERKYTHPMGDGTFLLVQPPERFVNHSCDNNTIVQDYCDVAIRTISIGEEITSDYSADGAAQSFPCHCQSEKCRGRIG